MKGRYPTIFIACAVWVGITVASFAALADDKEITTAAVGVTEESEGSSANPGPISIPPTSRSSFDRDTFEEFVDMRFGTGDPVYWYGMGVITSYPDGKILARLEGLDLGRIHRPNPDEPKAELFARKFAVFRDPVTNELLRDENGKVRFIGYNYQYFKVMLEGDELLWEIESGSKDRLRLTKGGHGAEVRKMGDLTVMTTPVPINSPVIQAWEKYDFLLMPEGSAEPRFQVVWGKYTPNFSWMPEGFSTMYSWLYRYDSYESLPESVRTLIETEPGLDLWRSPPESLEEIRELQRTGQNYR